MARIAVKVVPGASRTRVAGRYGQGIKVQVAAAAEKGKANQAVMQLLAETLGIRAAQIELIQGHTQPRKVFQINGIEQAELEAKLAGLQ
ncbi:MAG: DUF167 domain-containing protein [Planctomycetota bacterium]|nr:DUF167 domain-containing protein [Planctomycetota bacterium]